MILFFPLLHNKEHSFEGLFSRELKSSCNIEVSSYSWAKKPSHLHAYDQHDIYNCRCNCLD